MELQLPRTFLALVHSFDPTNEHSGQFATEMDCGGHDGGATGASFSRVYAASINLVKIEQISADLYCCSSGQTWSTDRQTLKVGRTQSPVVASVAQGEHEP